VRRITRLPGVLTGIRTAASWCGYPPTIMIVRPTRIGLGKKQLVRDMPAARSAGRWRPRASVRVIVTREDDRRRTAS